MFAFLHHHNRASRPLLALLGRGSEKRDLTHSRSRLSAMRDAGAIMYRPLNKVDP